jgi:hypothetical protein
VFTNELFDAEARLRRHVENRHAENRRQAAALAAYQARNLFHEARRRATLARVFAALLRRSPALCSLAEYVDHGAIRGRHAIGVRTIPLGAIRGSEGRGSDFDAAFRPLRTHTRGRWCSVAMAMYEGLALPPIDVILVGEQYFVRDGHHRVSVARSLGQVEIEANVTVWEVDAPVADAVLCQASMLT